MLTEFEKRVLGNLLFLGVIFLGCRVTGGVFALVISLMAAIAAISGRLWLVITCFVFVPMLTAFSTALASGAWLGVSARIGQIILLFAMLLVPGMQARTILIDSLSKKFAMTGWRLGWAIGPKQIVAAMTKMQENVAACAPLPSQYAAIEALSDNTDIAYIRETFEARRDLIYTEVNKCEKLSALKPAATFYIFVNIEKTGLKSIDFAIRLLESEHVAVVPGVAYGKAYDNFIRIAFTHDLPILQEACVRIRRFVEGGCK